MPEDRRPRAERQRSDLARRLARSLPQAALANLRKVGAEARRAGLRAFLVGGPVRDTLLRRRVLDVDVVIEGDAIALARALAERHGGTVRAHERFGTATWHPRSGPPIDLATARTETYATPAALPVVGRGTLTDDLFRRDFTVNAMAASLDPASFGELFDPHGGLADLRVRTLRVLHERSFEDDPTRAFRAARFVATLGKSIEADTRRFMRDALEAGHFEKLSPARVRRELVKALGGRRAPESAHALAHADLLRFLHPRLTLATETVRWLRRLEAALAWHERSFPAEAVERWALVLACAARRLKPDARAQLATRVGAQRFEREVVVEAPARAVKAAARLARLRRKTPSAVYASCAGESVETLLLATAASDRPAVRAALKRYLKELRHVRPAITGTDLLRAGVAAGPSIARGLEAALAAKLDGRATTRAQQLRIAVAAANRRHGGGATHP